MPKTQAQRAKAYRQKKRDADDKIVTELCDGLTGKRHENVTGPECDAVTARATFVEVLDEPTGPLDVYSEQRWAFLQGRGYVWQDSLQRGRKRDHIGVTVPGDPAYGPTGNNTCKSCGKDTGHKLVVKCLACCSKVA